MLLHVAQDSLGFPERFGF